MSKNIKNYDELTEEDVYGKQDEVYCVLCDELLDLVDVIDGKKICPVCLERLREEKDDE